MVDVEEKVWEYLVTHKTPVLASTLAKRFLVRKSHVSRILRDLEAKNVLDVIPIGSNKFYQVKE